MTGISSKGLLPWVVRTISRRPVMVLLSFSLLFGTAFLTTGLVRFDRDILKVLPRENRLFTVLLHAMESSTAQGRLLLLVQQKDKKQDLIHQARRLQSDLENLTLNGRPAFRQVTFTKSEAMGREAFDTLLRQYLEEPELFLSADDRKELIRFLRSPEAMEGELRKSIALIGTPGQSGLADMVARDPLNLRRFMIAKLGYFQEGLSFSAGPYLLSQDGNAALIMATPAAVFQPHSEAKKLLGKLKTRLRQYPGLEIGITGGYAIAAQEESLIKGDILGCLVGSVIAVSLLFFLIYRNVVVLSFVLIPLGVGLQLAVGTMALMFDTVHILALAFSAVILGLGIDFAIHIYDRYTSERQQGTDIETAVGRSITKTGSAVLAGGITTLAAFFVITLADSPVLRQIGWLVLLGLFFCLAAVVWALPAWLVLAERFSPRWLRKPAHLLGMNRLGAWVDSHPRTALIISLLIFLAGASGLPQAGFEKDIFALKPKQLEALDVQQDLLKVFGTGQAYVLVSWPAHTSEKLWAGSHQLDAILHKAVADGRQITWTSLTRFSEKGTLQVPGVAPDQVADLFTRYGLNLPEFTSLADFLQRITRQNPTLTDISPCDRFPDIFDRFFICDRKPVIGITWVQVDTEKTIRYIQEQLRGADFAFLAVNPQLAIDDFVHQSRSNLWQALGLAGLFVIVVLSVYFRQPRQVILALVPVSMGLAASAGFMGWFGIHLNVFNFIVLPILIGIGLDDGIHILARYSESKTIPRTIQSTGRSILVTTLTTICGFGSLYLARYHVLESMGLFAIVGITACFFFSIITLTALIKLMEGPAA